MCNRSKINKNLILNSKIRYQSYIIVRFIKIKGLGEKNAKTNSIHDETSIPHID